ncbi:MAG: hypothetical protein ABFE01_27135 [Phycisphaerales bacterium]|jgi:hypothetical protein
MKVDLIGQARLVMQGNVPNDPDGLGSDDSWDDFGDDFWGDTWATLEAIRRDELPPYFGGKPPQSIFQYARDMDDPDRSVKFNSKGKFVVLHGEMLAVNHVRYHTIDVQP